MKKQKQILVIENRFIAVVGLFRTFPLLMWIVLSDFLAGIRLSSAGGWASPKKNCSLTNWICLDLYAPYILILLIMCQYLKHCHCHSEPCATYSVQIIL